MKTRLHLFQLKQLVSFPSVHVYVCPIVICLFSFLYFSIPINNWEHMHFLWLEQQIDVYLPHSRLFLSSSVEAGPHFPVSFANGQCHFLCHWVGMVATGTTPGHRLWCAVSPSNKQKWISFSICLWGPYVENFSCTIPDSGKTLGWQRSYLQSEHFSESILVGSYCIWALHNLGLMRYSCYFMMAIIPLFHGKIRDKNVRGS